MVLIQQILSTPKARPLRKGLRRVDQFVQQLLDRTLPKSLTTRYILGLGAVASLSIFGQILVQVSLRDQFATQKSIWLLDRNVPQIEELRKNALALQLSSNHADAKRRADTIKNVMSHLNDSEKNPQKNSHFFSVEKDATEVSAVKSLERLSLASAKLTEKFLVAPQRPRRGIDEELPGLAKDVIDAAATYEAEVKQSIRHYEQKIDRQINSFQKTELFLLFATLLVLVLEALYVFRPAVTRLYEALRMRSDFLSRMSHELRNPMNSIMGMANLLGETAVSNQQKNYISILRRSSKSLLEILNGLLDFSSIESGVLRLENNEFDLYELLERCLDLTVVGAHTNETELIFDLDPNVPQKIRGDSLRIQQVLSNLLGNAAKFTKKGEIKLDVRRTGTELSPMLHFKVSDTGIGIDKDKLRTVFEPFVQEDSSIRRRYGGSGLGLTIAKDIVSRMNGKLEAESEKNQGSCFSFEIPMDVPLAENPLNGLNLQSFTPFDAFVLDANQSVRAAIQKSLKFFGAASVTSGDIGAVDTFIDKTTVPQVILINYEQGRNHLSHLTRKLGPRLSRVIFMLDPMISTTDIERLVAEGGKIFLFKPVKPVQLHDAVTTSLTGTADALATNPALVLPSSQKVPRFSRNVRILIADDSKENQFLFKAYLQFLPGELTLADNGREAYELCKQTNFDLILMDVQMPELDGYAAVKLIREWEKIQRQRQVPILGISAYSMSDRAKAAGFSSYLVKPVAPQTLRKEVLDLLAVTVLTTDQSVSSFTLERSSNMGQQNTTPLSQEAINAQLEKRMAELAPNYLANRRKELLDLKKFAASSEVESVQRIGHRLKGNALSYGFPELGKLGSDLEKAAQAQDFTLIHKVISKIETFLESAKPPVV